MKIIDWETRENIVRFYLGDDELKEWYGDDWDDKPYEHNAGRVYSQFVTKTMDVNFNCDDLIVEPCEGYTNSYLSKNDFRDRNIPCLIIVRSIDLPDNQLEFSTFEDWSDYKKSIKVYFGDDVHEIAGRYLGGNEHIVDNDKIKTIEYMLDRNELKFWDRENPDNDDEIILDDLVEWDEINDKAIEMMKERYPEGTIFIET